MSHLHCIWSPQSILGRKKRQLLDYVLRIFVTEFCKDLANILHCQVIVPKAWPIWINLQRSQADELCFELNHPENKDGQGAKTNISLLRIIPEKCRISFLHYAVINSVSNYEIKNFHGFVNNWVHQQKYLQWVNIFMQSIIVSFAGCQISRSRCISTMHMCNQRLPSLTFSSLWPTYMLINSGPFTL